MKTEVKEGSKYNIEWLRSFNQDNIYIEYIYFWKPTVTDSISKTCFSQWYKSDFRVDGIDYPTAEHWMMSQKALLFGDTTIYKEILVTEDPGKVQILGRKIKNFDLKIWNENCFGIVSKGNYYKFGQNEALKHFLLETDDAVLVEASPLDRTWGIGLSEEDEASSNNPYLWKGLNLLGFALMEVRDRLKQEKE